MCRCQFWVPTGALYSEDIGDSGKATKPEDIALSTLKLLGPRNQSLCATSAWPLRSREIVLHVIQPLILPTIHLKRTIMKGILSPPHLNFCEPYGRGWWLPRLQQAQEAPSLHPTPLLILSNSLPICLTIFILSDCILILACKYIYLYIIKSTDPLTVISIIPAYKRSLAPQEITMRPETLAVLDLEGKWFHSWAPSLRLSCQKLFTSPSS